MPPRYSMSPGPFVIQRRASGLYVPLALENLQRISDFCLIPSLEDLVGSFLLGESFENLRQFPGQTITILP